MTRQEFIDYVQDFNDLREFANDNDLFDPIEDLVDDDEIDDEVESELEELARNERWMCVRDTLNDIPTGTGWFIRTGYLEYEEASDYDFEDMKQAVLEAADEAEVWGEEEYDDYEDDDDDDDEDDEDEDDEGDDDYDPSSVMSDLFGAKAS